MSRTYTNKLLEMIEEGILDKDNVIMACVKYMSESDVQDMMESNEFVEEEIWVIRDWTDKLCFEGIEFPSFDAGEEWLSDKLGENYDTDRQEYTIEEK